MVVEKRGDKYCVIHCHGPDTGKPIKCFDTEAEAQAMHRAIEANKKGSFARFPSLTACCVEMKGLGHIAEDAMKICTGILERALKGALLKAQTNGLELLSKADANDIILGGYASWAVEDADGDFFTVEAQQKALERFFQTAPEYQLITINHGRGIVGEVNIARPLLKAVGADGKEYFSHVNEAGTFLVCKMRNDSLRATQYYRRKAREGELNGYSVNAFVLERDAENKVVDMEYSAITITEKGVATPRNPKTRDVKVIRKASEVKTEMLKATEKASKEEIEKELLDKYRERAALNSMLYPQSKFEVPYTIGDTSNPLAEIARAELEQKLNLLNVQIYALEDILKQKIIAENKANTLPKPVQKADLSTEQILAKYGFTKCSGKSSE